MPHFSATAATEAHDPWTVEIDGVVHRGRPISRPALLRFYAAMVAANGDPFKEEAALRAFLRLAFPARWRYVIQPERDPVTRILNLPEKQGERRPRDEALDSFFDAVDPTYGPRRNRTNGQSVKSPSSEAPTP
jgi:hypothetical protein